jgi:serine/threonine protein kinase
MNTDIKKFLGKQYDSYIIIKYISSGSFGHVFEGINTKNDKPVAIKIPIKNKDKDGTDCLNKEIKIYKEISDPKRGFINMKAIKTEDNRIIVMDLLGVSLESVISKRKKIGLKSVIHLAKQMILIMKYLHSFGYIHRDIKPDNFVIGRKDKSKLYCIDLGLCKKIISNNKHIPFCDNKSIVGTIRYSPIASTESFEQGRKDDLESIAYVLIYLFNGTLPWMGIKAKTKEERYRLIGEKKKSLSEEELTVGMPKEFCVFLKYVRNMDFDDKPPYTAFYNMFDRLYQSKNYKNNKFDFE